MRFTRFVVAMALAALASPGRAQTPERLLDLNPGPDDGLHYFWWWNPPEHSESFLAPLADELLFSGDDGVHGGELWRTDGTPGGTVLVADLLPGPSSSLLQAAGEAHRLADLLLFGANDAAGVRELWRTDGTAEGTTRLVGAPNAVAYGLYAAAGDALYFPAFSTDSGWELWASDGTLEGTARVVDLVPGPEGTAFDALAALGSDVVFFAETGTGTSSLWRTDGTEAGTVKLHDFGIEGATTEIVSLGATVWFGAVDAVEGPSLWRSDGTPEGTVPVRDVSGAVVQDPRHVATFGTRLFFFDDHRLWQSLGGPASELRVFDCTECRFELFGTPSYLFFSVENVGGGTLEPRFHELWRTDGSAAGTVFLAASPEPTAFLEQAVWTGERLYFATHLEATGTELWSSDGTPGGTALAADLEPGPGSSDPRHLTVAGGRLYFSAFQEGFGRELWSMGLGESISEAPLTGYTTLEGDLVRLDLAGGGVAPVGPVGHQVAGLAFDPRGRLFGISPGGELILIDTETGAGTWTASILLADPAGEVRDLAFDACGDLWVTSRAGSSSSLFAVDPATGDATLVGTNEHGLRTLTAHGREVLGLADFGPASGPWLVDVDTTDAGFSNRRRAAGLTGPSSTLPDRIDFDERGFLWGLGPARTWVLDPSTGAARELSTAADRSYSGLAVGRPPGRCPAGACRPGAGRHCFLDGRFQVEVDWRDFRGRSGTGRAVPGAADDSGLFYFFGPDNWELMVKTLDGCRLNGHFWVFASASTNVEYHLRVTDTVTGEVRIYSNPLGQTAETVTDTAAFEDCP